MIPSVAEVIIPNKRRRALVGIRYILKSQCITITEFSNYLVKVSSSKRPDVLTRCAVRDRDTVQVAFLQVRAGRGNKCVGRAFLDGVHSPANTGVNLTCVDYRRGVALGGVCLAAPYWISYQLPLVRIRAFGFLVQTVKVSDSCPASFGVRTGAIRFMYWIEI